MLSALGFFDPTTCLMGMNLPPKGSAVSRRTNVSEHALLTFIHELRHWHDLVGTTEGLIIFQTFIDRANRFLGFWHDVVEERKLFLPLRKWVKMPDSPPSLKEFLKQYDKTNQVSNFIGLSFIPSQWTQSTFPLGLLALFEGNAWCIEIAAIKEIIGNKKKAFQFVQSTLRDPQYDPYTATSRMVLKKCGGFNPNIVITFSDVAMMIDPDNIIPGEDAYAGARYAKILKNIDLNFLELCNLSSDEIAKIVCRSLGWLTPYEASLKALSWIKIRIEKHSKSPNFLFKFLIEFLNASQIAFLARKKYGQDMVSNPKFYLKNLSHFPIAPLMWEKDQIRIGAKNSWVNWQLWFYINFFIKSLVNSGLICCPTKMFVSEFEHLRCKSLRSACDSPNQHINCEFHAFLGALKINSVKTRNLK